MDLPSLVTRLRALRWWFGRPRALYFKLVRLIRRRKVEPYYRQWLATLVAAPGSASHPSGPRLSVAMPVFRVQEEHLREAIASVQRQTFPHFEFLLLNDASPEPHVPRVLAAAQAEDSRIRLLSNRTRAGISGAANRLLQEAHGDYVVFVDHDDTLAPYALERAADAVRRFPEGDWFFSDEDKANHRGVFGEPCFKPGFSAHLLLSWNFVSHLRVVRRDKALALGGYRVGLEGAQDWDLALRLLVASGRFRHIPQVLYHWRKTRGSMALGAAAKAFANRAAEKAIREALGALFSASNVEVRPLVSGASQFAVSWQSPPTVGVSLVLTHRSAPPRCQRPHQVLRVDSLEDPEALEAALSKAQFDAVAVLPPEGMSSPALERLLSRLLLPGTAAVGGCCVRRGRIVGSGFLTDRAGAWRDPLAGLSDDDPGYCNLAWLPQPRAVLLPWGFVAWRRLLHRGWRSASHVPPPWRLTVGLAGLEEECVVLPEVRFSHWSPTPQPLPLLPPGPYQWRAEWDLFRLCP